MKLFIYYLLFVVICLGCQKKQPYFKGDTILTKDIAITDTLKGENVVFDSINSGIISLCDSLVFFYSHRMPNYQYHCFNINTGKFISNFFPKGRGVGEFLNVTPIIQKYKENGDTKALFTAINEEKAGIFNISHSVQQKTTIFDTVFDFKWRDKSTKSFMSVFQFDNDRILAFKQPNKTTSVEDRYSLPQFLMINYRTGHIEKSYDLYNEPVIYNPEAKNFNELFYSSFNLINSDRTKIVMFMSLIPQINILDIKTGNLKGIQISGSPGFDDLKGSVDKFKQYYNFSDIDDNYIYALRVDKSVTDFNSKINSSIINVFDWNGNLVHKLYIDTNLDQIQVDAKNRLMYGVRLETEEVFRYKLAF